MQGRTRAHTIFECFITHPRCLQGSQIGLQACAALQMLLQIRDALRRKRQGWPIDSGDAARAAWLRSDSRSERLSRDASQAVNVCCKASHCCISTSDLYRAVQLRDCSFDSCGSMAIGPMCDLPYVNQACTFCCFRSVKQMGTWFDDRLGCWALPPGAASQAARQQLGTRISLQTSRLHDDACGIRDPITNGSRMCDPDGVLSGSSECGSGGGGSW